MHNGIDLFLEQMRGAGLSDRRNGSFCSHLLTEVGDLELRIPRASHFSGRAVLKRFARRPVSVERTILLCFLLRLSTREVGPALLSILGEPVSLSTSSGQAQDLSTQLVLFAESSVFSLMEFGTCPGREGLDPSSELRTLRVSKGKKGAISIE